MIQKTLSFFKNNEKDEKDEKEYEPTLFETWRFYFKFLKLDIKILGALFSVRYPFLILSIQQAILNNDDITLFYYALEFIVCELIMQSSHYVEILLNGNFHLRSMQTVQKSILSHLFSLDVQYFEDNKVTQISEMAKIGTEQICHELSYGNLINIFDRYVKCFGRFYFIYSISPMILLVMCISTFVFAALQFFIQTIKDKKEKEFSKNNEFKSFAIDDILNNIILIKTLGTEQYEVESINKTIEQNAESQKEITTFGQIQNLFSNLNNRIVKVIIIIQIFFQFGLPSDINNIAQSLSQIFEILLFAFSINNDILKIIFQKTDNYHSASKKNIGKIMELFQQKPKIPQDFNEDENDKSQFQGEIIFESVSFKYPITKDFLAEMNQKRQEEERKQKEDAEDSTSTQLNEKQQTPKLQKSTLTLIHSDELDDNDEDKEDNQNKSTNLIEQVVQKQDSFQQLLLKKSQSITKERQYVLENVSFKIKKGQTVAFVGTSGCGKSTIVKLIQRFYDTSSGSILLDGQNIKDISLSKLRRSIGLVSQEPQLFDNDIEYNITYGCENGVYSQEELRKICDMSGVSEFVFDEKRFPKGLKTLVGTKGSKLSGGQKQRIAIARALIKKPKILILDEATSALDAESEHIVQQYIDKLAGHRGLTIITVAHRLSTIAKSDVIFVMRQGQIKEQGTHHELIAKNGVYKKLIHHQINFQQNINQQ